MGWGAFAAAAASALSSKKSEQQGGSSTPLVSDSDAAPVTVNVGGLNVPAFPNFPAYQNTVTGQTITPQNDTLNQNTMMMMVVGVVGVVVLFKAKK